MSRTLTVVSLLVVMLVAAVLLPAPAAASSESYGTSHCSYVVKWGDTLSRIAQRHGTTVWAIMSANPRIKSPDRIWAGMCLNIPGGWDGGWSANHYIVRPGDTLNRIAWRFGTSVWAIMHANPHIWNPDRIYAGQKLVIPG